jgi:DNA-binding MarR family transcriptional regulator
MDGPRWLTDQQLTAWRAFSVMQLQLTSLLDRELRRFGLSYADYVVLAALSETDGRMDMADLRAVLGWEKSRLSHQLRRMQGRDQVARRPHPDDGRQVVVEITDTGRAAIGRAAPDHVAVVRRYVIEPLSSAQLEALGTASRIVLDGLPPP